MSWEKNILGSKKNSHRRAKKGFAGNDEFFTPLLAIR
jgi:hypothetical protein